MSRANTEATCKDGAIERVVSSHSVVHSEQPKGEHTLRDTLGFTPSNYDRSNSYSLSLVAPSPLSCINHSGDKLGLRQQDEINQTPSTSLQPPTTSFYAKPPPDTTMMFLLLRSLLRPVRVAPNRWRQGTARQSSLIGSSRGGCSKTSERTTVRRNNERKHVTKKTRSLLLEGICYLFKNAQRQQ